LRKITRERLSFLSKFPGKDEDVDELWLTEAESRLREYDEGTASARDIDDALLEIEKQLR